GVHVFDDGFDDVVGRGEVVERRRDGKPAERGVTIGGAQLALLDELRERLVDAGPGAIERRLRDVVQGDGKAGLREHLSDAGAHGSGADDGDLSGAHARGSILSKAWPLQFYSLRSVTAGSMLLAFRAGR